MLESSISDLLEVSNVKASATIGKIDIEHNGHPPSAEKLTSLFKVNGYEFSTNPFFGSKRVWPYLIGLALVMAFIGFNKLGWSSAFNITEESPAFLFLIFGLIAGLSTCAALVGGIVLSISDEFAKMQIGEKTLLGETLPHLQFNFGRLVSFTAIGFVFGAVGSQLRFSPIFTAILVVVISLTMFWLGLQMLGVKFAQKIHIGLPKRFTQNITKKDKSAGRLVAFGIGALTVLLPCGFTLTAEGVAILSGSPVRGALIMMMFVLGTMPVLMIIGVTSAKLHENPARAKIFSTIAGIVVLFFAMYNISNQLNVLGINVSALSAKPSQAKEVLQDRDLPPLENGKQVIIMNASAHGYSPNYFKVRAGIPVHWEITDTGTSGCTNAIISFKLFKDQISLTPGETSVKEFTPTMPGRYKFSCWMGMVSGVIEVVK